MNSVASSSYRTQQRSGVQVGSPPFTAGLTVSHVIFRCNFHLQHGRVSLSMVVWLVRSRSWQIDNAVFADLLGLGRRREQPRVDALQRYDNGSSFLSAFPYVCPEPVLANVQFCCIKMAQKGAFSSYLGDV